MSIIDAYGDFELPEEKSVIEVVEDPIKIIDACYERFVKLCEKIRKQFQSEWILYQDGAHFAEEAYNQMCKFFDEKQLKKLNINQNSALEFLRTKAMPQDHSGIFLSALQNNSNLDKLILTDFPRGCSSYPQHAATIEGIGYRLKESKILVLEQDISANYVGEHSEGIIINKGTVGWLGNSTKKGIIINKGNAECSFANYCKDGIQINEGSCQYMAVLAKDGIQINNGIVGINQRNSLNLMDFLLGGFLTRELPPKWGLLCNLSKGGIHINNGKIHGINYHPEGTKGLEINLNKSYLNKIRKRIFNQKKYKLEKKLQNKLKELEFLKTNNTEELVKYVEAYDWKTFEQEIKTIAEEIKEKHEDLIKWA